MTARILLVAFDGNWSNKLGTALSSIGDFQITANASNLMEAYSMSEETKPDFVLVAHHLTRLPEFEMLLALFAVLNVRWMAVTDRARTGDIVGSSHTGRQSGIFTFDVSDSIPASAAHIASMLNSKRTASASGSTKKPLSSTKTNQLILLGSSTGGVEALSVVLKDYPENCAPTLIVQHTGQSFGDGLVQLLDRLSPARVVKASAGLRMTRGMVCVAAGGEMHLTVDPGNLHCPKLSPGEKISGHRPSVDALFQSAVPIAKLCVAGILTGMGRDGADGLLALRRAGARTFCQDRRTSVVYGMPKVAWEMGAGDLELPLQNVAGHLATLTQ